MSKNWAYGNKAPIVRAWQCDVKLLWRGTDERGENVIREWTSFSNIAATTDGTIDGAIQDLKVLKGMRPQVKRAITINEAAKRMGLK